MSSHEKTTVFYVNGERESTEGEALTVGQILEKAGFTPISEFTLASDNPRRNYDSNYEESVKIHENQRFDALHKGPTPTS